MYDYLTCTVWSLKPNNIRHDPVVTPLHKRGPPAHNNDDPVVVPSHKRGPPANNNDDPVIVPYHNRGSSPSGNDPALTAVHKRPPSPPKHRPPERSRKSNSPPAALLPPFPGRQPSPGRRLSPSRPDGEDFPSAPPPVEEKDRVESHPNPGSSLPPIPPIGSGRSTSPAPVPAARANRKAKEDEDSSPVVVPLKSRHKGALPPLPPPQSKKPSFPRAPFKPDNGEAATAPLSGRGAEEEEQEEEEDVHQKQIDAGPVKPKTKRQTSLQVHVLAFHCMTVSGLNVYAFSSRFASGTVALRACDCIHIIIRTVPVFAWPSFNGLILSTESVGPPVCTHLHASCVSMILVYGKENKYYFKKITR